MPCLLPRDASCQVPTQAKPARCPSPHCTEGAHVHSVCTHVRSAQAVNGRLLRRHHRRPGVRRGQVDDRCLQGEVVQQQVEQVHFTTVATAAASPLATELHGATESQPAAKQVKVPQRCHTTLVGLMASPLAPPCHRALCHPRRLPSATVVAPHHDQAPATPLTQGASKPVLCKPSLNRCRRSYQILIQAAPQVRKAVRL